MFSNCQAIKLGRPKGNPWETRLQDENKNYFQEMKEEREKEKRREREKEQKTLRTEIVYSRRGRFHRFHSFSL